MDTTAGGAPDAARTDRWGAPGPRGRKRPGAPRDPSALSDPGSLEVRLLRPRRGGTDVVGLAVLASCAIWALVAAAGRPARPEGTLLALLAVTAGYAAGRILGALLPVVAPALAAAVVLALVLIPPSRLSAGPDAPPLGYANADAALLVLAVGAAGCASWATRSGGWRLGLRLVGVGAAVVALALGSVAGFAAGITVMLCSLAAGRVRKRLPGLAALALVAALAVGGSYAVAVDALPAGLSTSLAGELTQPRVELWHEAAVLAEHHPLRGVGPERFADESDASTALSVQPPPTESLRSAPLQTAAEEGFPGVALLAAAYGWLLCALWRSSRPTPVALTAAATLTALALLSTVDRVLSYAVVTAAAGCLAGIATARPMAEDGADGPAAG